jgi:hypothetical protein
MQFRLQLTYNTVAQMRRIVFQDLGFVVEVNTKQRVVDQFKMLFKISDREIHG